MELKINNQENEIQAVLTGRLDTVASTQFATDMKPLLDNADKTIVLNCERLEFISSSGLRLFLTLRKATLAPDLGSGVLGREGSSPFRRTHISVKHISLC